MKVDIKSKSELDRMRVACRMSAEIRDICAAAVAPGVTTGEIDDLVVEYCRKHNVKASFYGYAGFPGHLCVSINDEVIHGIPDRSRVIMPGDLVSTDVGILTQGFNGDTSRTVALGVTDPEVLRLVETTKRCLAAGIAACGPGVHLGDVGYAIQKVAEDAGFGVIRDWIGHGVGRTVHEDPEVPNYGKPGTKLVLRPGMTIAIEPMISMTKAGERTEVLSNEWTVVTRDRSLSAHFEHTVAITDDGCEVLTLPADYP
ncbi:MAG: type I methionyl aminopeptidase [Kiritimatiellae bacterium]|nr:type I methionyl aminopeptidase [Kiritimatiellia bacterium]